MIRFRLNSPATLCPDDAERTRKRFRLVLPTAHSITAIAACRINYCLSGSLPWRQAQPYLPWELQQALPPLLSLAPDTGYSGHFPAPTNALGSFRQCVLHPRASSDPGPDLSKSLGQSAPPSIPSIGAVDGIPPPSMYVAGLYSSGPPIDRPSRVLLQALPRHSQKICSLLYWHRHDKPSPPFRILLHHFRLSNLNGSGILFYQIRLMIDPRLATFILY